MDIESRIDTILQDFEYMRGKAKTTDEYGSAHRQATAAITELVREAERQALLEGRMDVRRDLIHWANDCKEDFEELINLQALAQLATPANHEKGHHEE